MPRVSCLDHLVLTVSDMATTMSFYETVLGMTAHSFHPSDGTMRWMLSFGDQKIILHMAGQEFIPHAKITTPGSAELCFLTETPISDWVAHLTAHDILILEGPVNRSGATGPILSIYIRDPDGNLIELSNPA